MAYAKHNPASDKHYIADTLADMKEIIGYIGDTCLVIEDGKTYMSNSKHEWVAPAIEESTATPEADLSEYVTKDMIASYLPKYVVMNCPVETSIDSRDKEIRIFCHEDAVFTKQTVGEGGNPNMYYMTFRSYAPAGAVYLKEGDRGVIIDEEIQLQGGTGTGVDKDGRAYKDHWFALATYDEASDSWNYFGKTSTVSKYIGWSYVVEWYDANGKMINTDAIRINLSNKDCHNKLAHYYG